MADSFFGFDTSNLDDEGVGEPSEDEYDALNNETFGQDSDAFDWEVEHEQLAEQLESSRRHHSIDDVNSQLEASLSQLVLDEPDSRQPRTLGSSVWRHDLPISTAPTPVQQLKNVCTVEELERQLRQKQTAQTGQNYYQPRFAPIILQRPPGLQAPVPLPFAPQPQMNNMRGDINQPLNKLLGQPMNQPNQLLQNHIPHVNQMGPNLNQMGQNVNQQMSSVNQFMQSANQMNQYQNNQMVQNSIMGLAQNMQGSMLQNQMGQNVNQMMQNQLVQIGQSQMQLNQNQAQMGQNFVQNILNPSVPQNVNAMNQISQNVNLNQPLTQVGQNINQQMNQPGQNMNQMGPNVQMGVNVNQMGLNVNQMGPNQMVPNQMNQNVNQIGPNTNHMNQNPMGQNVSQMGQNLNQMMPNGNQFNGMNQFPHMMQPRMIAPPPGMNMPRQNFSSNVGQYNPNFRPTTQHKSSEPGTQPPNQFQQKNQSPIKRAQSPKTVKPLPKVEPKGKNRVINSKTQPNLTWQNLVQIIQNTHPMLQNNINSSYHNASHHPMLNTRVFNNQYSNNGNIYNQRQNGSYSNNRNMNGDDASTHSDSDEYAGLMTQREKQWLINIQMLQLNTGTPYIHDFYYTVFLERQANKEREGVKEAHKANQKNHPFYSGGVKQETHSHPQHRERHNSNRHNSTSEESAPPRTYVPTQFENSLGKLQCGSVTAPRKIIDVELVPAESHSRAPSRASTVNPSEVPREMKRTKQLLLDIEALYLILLRIEELNDPLAISNALILKEREEKQKQFEAAQKELESQQEDESNVFLRNIESVQRRPKQDSPKCETIDKRQVVSLAISQKPPVKNLLDEDKQELIGKMFAGLLHGDRLPHVLTVRKGRLVVTRFLSLTSPNHVRVRAVWSRVLRGLSALSRRHEDALSGLAPHFARYIQSTTGWAPVLESCYILAESFDPARTPHALTSPFTLSCVCALLERAVTLVNTPDATSNERQWSKFLKTLARALKNTTLTVAKPLQPLPETKLMCHLKQLESRNTIEILQRGKTATEFADISKADVQEQLVKHLC